MIFRPTEQTIDWFKNEHLKGTLIIKPPYQRKPVWVSKQKCSLIETILLGLPIPEVYIHKTTTPEGLTTHAIVDGQQRIRTVLEFIGSEMEDIESEYSKFPLDKLPDSEWYNYTFADLPDDKKRDFWAYTFSVRSLITDNEREIRDMFKRLNKFLTPLKPQELRNATYSGPFANLAVKVADYEFWSENKIVTPAGIRRMGDIEFVSELLIGVLHGPQDGGAKTIDEYYKQYEDFDDEFPEQRSATKLFNLTLETIKRVMGDIRDTRWTNKTDFYSLFVAFANMLRTDQIIRDTQGELAKAIIQFGDDIGRRMGDETYQANKNVVNYVRAVQKGANGKTRRAERHRALFEVMSNYFEKL